MGTLFLQQGFQPSMYRGQVLFCEKAPGNTGLVCYDKHPDAQVIGLTNCLSRFWNELKFFRSAKEIDFGVDRAIPVEKNPDLFLLHALLPQ